MTIWGEKRKGEVLITVGGAPLNWRSSLAVRNHSPTGPAWGYGGSGPAPLALAILLAVTDEATAEWFYQKFKWDVLAPLEADRWALDTGDILGWFGVGGGDGRRRAPSGDLKRGDSHGGRSERAPTARLSWAGEAGAGES